MKKHSIIKRNDETGDIILSNNLMDCWDMIEELHGNVPDKRTKDYKRWKDEINKLVNHANKLQGFKAYNLMK